MYKANGFLLNIMSNSPTDVPELLVTSSPIITFPASTKKLAFTVRPLAPFYPFELLFRASVRLGFAKSSGSCTYGYEL